METTEPIRILIVDDSRIFRGLLQSVLEQIAGVQIVGSVFSGEKALEFIEKTPTDLITLDVEMPGMGGLATLKEIAKRNKLNRTKPAIDTLLVSGLTRTGSMVTVEGLQLGALDFISKPSEGDERTNRDLLRNSLIEKLSAFRQRRSKAATSTTIPATKALDWNLRIPAARPQSKPFKAIAIGTSTGGPEALGAVLPSLAEKCDLPIFIVQHILHGLSQFLAESLSKKCGRSVFEVCSDRKVVQGGIYLASSSHHMALRNTEGGVVVCPLQSPPEKNCRPSVDVFLRSATAVYGSSLIAAILTGMGDDGAEGIRVVKRAGAHTIAQDQASSVVWGMPRAAIETGAIDDVVPLSMLSQTIIDLLAPGSPQ